MQSLSKIFKAASLKLLLVSVLFLASIFVFGFIADEMVMEKEDVFDFHVFQLLSSYSSPTVIAVMKTFTFFGKPDFLVPGYLLLIGYFLWKKKTNHAIDIALIAVSSTLLLFALKRIFQRQRPNFPILQTLHTYSFPSGHALCSFIFCSIFIYFIWQSRLPHLLKWMFSILLFLFSLMVGISRIFLRYHYASDVLAGFCLGYVYVIVYLWLQKKFFNRGLSITG